MLTKEQLDIIKLSQNLKPNELLKINAIAGSGKTTTLKEIALANPNKSFLYLAFNKAIVGECKGKFPENVELKTTHSLAYSKVISPRKKLGLKTEVINNYKIWDYAKALNFNEKDYDKAYLFSQSLNSFLNSAQPFNMANDDIRVFFKMVQKGTLPYSHNLYLKEYEMLEKKELEYDFILLDEAQDTNAVTLSIFLKNSARKILVGDSFQNIYAFRDTINALNSESLNANHTAILSHSFRCKQDILDKANFFLNHFFISKIDLEKPCQFVSAYIKKDEPYKKAIITRTNVKIIEFLEKNKDFNLLKEPYSVFGATINLYKWQRGQELDKNYEWFNKFNSLEELKKYADGILDLDLLSALEFVDNKVLSQNELDRLYLKAVKSYKEQNESKIYLTNAHLAKGLEFNEIEISDDFTPLIELKKSILKLYDELKEPKADKNIIYKKILKANNSLTQERNLYYVTLTRAKEVIVDNSKNAKFYENIIKKGLK